MCGMFAAFLAIAFATSGATQDYRPDLNLLIDSLKQNGAYVIDDHIDLEELRRAYAPKFANVSDKKQVLGLLEAVVGELHDFHATLGANNDASPRLVPSGADLIGHWAGNRAVIDQIRVGSIAERNGLMAGDQVLTLNGLSIKSAAKQWLGIRKPDARAWDWALNSALAGRWNSPRNLEILSQGKKRVAKLATPIQPKFDHVLTIERRGGSVLYLRPENSLGESALISAFDKAVPAMRTAKKVVIDLRNTPSGGTSYVARGMMGLFVGMRMPFQRHRAEERDTATVRDWVEYVTPRLTTPVRTPLVVLVGRWTGSMGEGIAIGFDAMHRATVIGTEMARLRGAVDRLDLPLCGIGVNFPTEQVFHLNGTPRHEWLPPVLVKPGKGDAWWNTASSTQSRPAEKNGAGKTGVKGA